MELFEQIDVLLESPESIGIPEPVANQIRELISDRKSQDYAAKIFKQFEFEGRIHSDIFTDLISDLGLDEEKFFKEFTKAMGRKVVEEGSTILVTNWEGDILTGVANFSGRSLYGAFSEDILSVSDVLTIKNKSKKSLKRMNKQGLIDDLVDYFEDRIKDLFSVFLSENEFLFKFLDKDPNNWMKIKGQEPGKALETSKIEYMKVEPEESRITHRFPDDYFWYKLIEEEHEFEGESLNHCGTVDMGDMYSLRDSNNNPCVTVEKTREDKIIQIRGDSNETPDNKYWNKIRWFVSEHDAHIEDEEHDQPFLENVTRDGGSYGQSLLEYADIYFMNAPREVFDIDERYWEVDTHSESDNFKTVELYAFVEEMTIPITDFKKYDIDRDISDYIDAIKGRPADEFIISILRKIFNQKNIFSEVDTLKKANVNFEFHDWSPERSKIHVQFPMFRLHATTEQEVDRFSKWLKFVINEDTREMVTANFFFDYIELNLD